MIRIKDYIFNENEIVKIQFDDGSKEMEIDHTNGNRTFIDGTFDDIEWNYENSISESLSYDLAKARIKQLEEHNKELVETNYDLAIKKTKLEEENKKLKDELELKDFNYTKFRHLEESNDILKEELEEEENKIDKATEYTEHIDNFDIKDFRRKELLKILRGEENESN